ncbi:unnamed protein product [Prorocentrum cordatum]|uniref:Secreted protein n=1 Tax=Prorocentrum cordatum TaxID=2364126 RepID=A0ABN9T201_9DINO|nr:unnamed protein product [Polarella glacialis]
MMSWMILLMISAACHPPALTIKADKASSPTPLLPPTDWMTTKISLVVGLKDDARKGGVMLTRPSMRLRASLPAQPAGSAAGRGSGWAPAGRHVTSSGTRGWLGTGS